MRELIVVLALLARCWSVIEVLCKRSMAMPTDTIDEVQALRQELGRFFRDPMTALGPLMGDALGIGAEEGETGVSEDAGSVVVPSGGSEDGGEFAVDGRLICPQCLGKKDRPANNFIGDRSRVTCPQCNGVGSLSAPLPVSEAAPAAKAREWEPYCFTRAT